MAELKLTFTDSQVTRIKAAVKMKYGKTDERTPTQLVQIDIKDYLKSLVREQEQKVEVAKINLTAF